MIRHGRWGGRSGARQAKLTPSRFSVRQITRQVRFGAPSTCSSNSRGMPNVPEWTWRQAPPSDRFRTAHSIFGAFALTAMRPDLRTLVRLFLRRSSMAPTLHRGAAIAVILPAWLCDSLNRTGDCRPARAVRRPTAGRGVSGCPRGPGDRDGVSVGDGATRRRRSAGDTRSGAQGTLGQGAESRPKASRKPAPRPRDKQT